MDFSAKQEIIESIASEVNELHPLLESFLGKLENIIQIEYTHGPQEKGADFVLTRLDPALTTISHIGVVVKRGKITNDITDVARQIEECGMPRLIRGGRERVRLSEIWVVNNGSISANAKEKIHDTYNKQRIEFIDAQLLTQLVDKHAEYYWHKIPSPVGTYLEQLSKRLAAAEKESGLVGNLGCDEFYVEPDIFEIEKISYVNKRRPTAPRNVNFLEEAINGNVSVLEAEMGFGKSKTVRRICRHFCAADRFNQSKILPLFYSFRFYHEKSYTLDNLLKLQLGDVLLDVEHLGVKILVVLDGVDEAATNGAWKDTLKAVISQAKADARVRLILTTRPLRVLDEDVDIFAGVRRYTLRPLSVSKVVQFIQKACQNISVPKRIYEDLQRSDLFKQLPQSPIAAALLSSLIAQNQNDLPSNLTELYSKSLEYMLGRWDVIKGIAPEKEYQAAERVALLIAEYMVSNQLIWMSVTEAETMVKAWHSRRNLGVDLDHLLSRVFAKSGIFTIDEETCTLSFRHRSFGEYLYAKSMRANPGTFDVKNCFQPYWIESSFFYIGLLGDCPDLLKQLFAASTNTESEEWAKILSLPDYVLAGWQTEYAIVEENLYKLFLEAAKLYHRIRAGDTKTKLVQLSEMHLLWFFQRIIRHSFDYEFLRPAIGSTILRIDGELEDKEHRIYALFFASCFAAQMDDASGFEYILKTYPAETIPLPISLAIKLETNEKKDFSKLPLIKTHEKRLQKMLAAPYTGSSASNLQRASTDARITELFEKPLKSRPVKKDN